MSKPVMADGLVDCKSCGSNNTVSLVETTDHMLEIPTVTWCSCGNIEVVITLGQKVTVVRG